jgi:MAF protein
MVASCRVTIENFRDLSKEVLSVQLILASSSRHRRRLLETLGLAFEVRRPDVDESPWADEAPASLVARLAQAKARAVAHDSMAELIIGSDQSAAVDGRFLTKPGDAQHAAEQLHWLSGRTVTFYTGLCLYNPATDRVQASVEPYNVTLRRLTDSQIEIYVQRDQPFDSAGAFRSEGLGIALFERLDGEDPNTLVGLPLIRLIEFLSNEGIEVLA